MLITRSVAIPIRLSRFFAVQEIGQHRRIGSLTPLRSPSGGFRKQPENLPDMPEIGEGCLLRVRASECVS